VWKNFRFGSLSGRFPRSITSVGEVASDTETAVACHAIGFKYTLLLAREQLSLGYFTQKPIDQIHNKSSITVRLGKVFLLESRDSGEGTVGRYSNKVKVAEPVWPDTCLLGTFINRHLRCCQDGSDHVQNYAFGDYSQLS
jgi:hypothetical protein